MTSDLTSLKRRLRETIADSPVRDVLGDTDLEIDQDENGEEFLRITIALKATSARRDDDLVDLLERIGETVGSIDERSSSVNFSEAA